jgi:hypothetical protein
MLPVAGLCIAILGNYKTGLADVNKQLYKSGKLGE